MFEKVTLQEYCEAVTALVPLANTGTSGGRVAAQVLLSAYNGDEFQLDISDLCCLSRDNYRAALTVIRGRVETNYEPHTLVENGENQFQALWDRWQASLHVRERGKDICFDCHGQGKVYLNANDEDEECMIPCRSCGGKGRY